MRAIAHGRGGFYAEVEAGVGVGGAEVFVGVESGEGGGVRNREEFAGNGCGGGVEDGAG